MYKPEFVALQASILIRSDQVASRDIQAFLETVEFKSEMQHHLATLVQDILRANKVSFDEVIISLDRPPERAKPTEAVRPSSDKPSLLERLLGRK